MSYDENRPEPIKKQKPKNFRRINARCKMGKLNEGRKPHACPVCHTVHKLKECPFGCKE